MKKKSLSLLCALALILAATAVPQFFRAQAAPDTENCEHVFEEIAGTRKDPTCTELGSVSVRCTLCGYEEHRALNALGHKFISEMEVPNLFGTVTRTCERCGESFKFRKSDYKEPEPETEPPVGASKYDDLSDSEKARIGVWNADPDPEQSGLKIVGKTDLSDYEHPECRCPITDEKNGSVHVNSYLTGDATCTQWGWEAFLPCAKCGELHSSIINKSINADLADKRITPQEAAEQREKYAWDFRYTTPPHGHKYENPTKEGYPAPTCTEEGLWCVHCDYWPECGECYYEIAEKLGHDYELQETTLVDDENRVAGYAATYTCTRCGDVHKPSVYGSIDGLKDGDRWTALGCRVTFKNVATGEETPGTNRNEAAGCGYFADLPAGTYTMTVSSDEYTTRDYTVKIRAGVQLKADVLLDKIGNYEETGFLDIGEADFSFPQQSYYETGEPLTPAVTVKDGDETLVEGVDYTVDYTYNLTWGYGYAKVKGIGAYTGHYNAPFRIDPKPQEDPGGSVLSPGDIDGSGEIEVTDARNALRAAVGLEDYAPDSPQFKAADTDGNGEIEVTDARNILRAAVGLDQPEDWAKQ